MKAVMLLGLLMMAAAGAGAGIHTETVEYRQGETVLEGYLAYDSSLIGRGVRPGVLVVHEWTGINDYVRSRVRQLAELGYVAFAADIYGKGIRPQNSDEASAQAKIYRADRRLFRERVKAGLAVLAAHPLSDDDRLAAIGYCFGGSAVLELARSGADVNGVVSFHGGLATPNPADAKNIKARVLVCHGAADPHVPAEEVAAFRDEMDAAGVDWQLIMYSGAVHSFTNPGAGDDPSKGAAYNEKAAARSWAHMRAFFDEIFK